MSVSLICLGGSERKMSEVVRVGLEVVRVGSEVSY